MRSYFVRTISRNKPIPKHNILLCLGIIAINEQKFVKVLTNFVICSNIYTNRYSKEGENNEKNFDGIDDWFCFI